MAISARLSRTLHVALGEDAAADMVTWMQGIDSSRSELRELNELSLARLEGRISEVRHELLAALDRRSAESIKWSFLFWCGTMLGIALLR